MVPAYTLILVALIFLSAHLHAKSLESIKSAFSKDHFNVTRSITLSTTSFGVSAEHLTAKVLTTQKPKTAYYVQGTPYEMGYLLGRLQSTQMEQMCIEYTANVVPELIAPSFFKKHQHEAWFKALLHSMEYLLKIGSFHSWNELISRKVDPPIIPSEIIDEMRGIVKGAQEEGATGVTMQQIVTLNYGFDYLLAHVFAGTLKQQLERFMPPTPWRNKILSLFDGTHAFLRIPQYCDSFSVTREATKSGHDTFFARDFQLPTGGQVLAKTITMIIYNPTPNTNQNQNQNQNSEPLNQNQNQNIEPLVSVAGPGMVGSLISLNRHGVAMGVDTLRTAYVNPSTVGLNEILLIRYAMGHSKSTEEAINVISQARRGLSNIYPISDANGNFVILENGYYDPDQIDTLEYAQRKLRPNLPTSDFIKKHSNAEFRNGVYVRRANYSYPTEFLSFNENLFKQAGVPFDSKRFQGLNPLFDSWQEERQVESQLENNYFPPSRLNSSNVIVTSNNAVVPQMRLSQMSFISNFLERTGESIQWRYDRLSKLIMDAYGEMDWERVKDIITFLSPKKTPGYWDDYVDPKDPMTAVIEGSISVANLKELVISSKYGYWCDDWITLQMRNYLE